MDRIKFKFAVVVPLLHLVAASTLFFTDSLGLMLAIAVVVYYTSHLLGYSICYHKLMAHRSFTPKKWYPYVGTFFGMLALHGSPLTSALTHRLHHKYSDTDKDPSDRNRGRWYAYLGWVFEYRVPRRNYVLINDLKRDYPWLIKIHGYELYVALSAYAFAYLIGGWTLFGGVLIGALAAFHTPLISNGFLHAIVDGKAQPINNSFMAKWFNPGANHAQHHARPSGVDYSTPEVKDWSATIIRRFLAA